MNRKHALQALKNTPEWDIIIIGGGATGLGAAVDASSRGYKTLLVEQHDFAKGTSSRSTKLVHGGVRYLAQGNIKLVLEALHERGLLLQNAPHLVSNQAFVVPNYKWWEGPFYGIGLKVYDLMAGKLGFGASTWLSREETLQKIPTLEPKGLRGGIIYYDGQFDDARLAINLAQTAVDKDGTVINYLKVRGLIKDGAFIGGVLATDQLSGKEVEIKGKVIINATGVFSDRIVQMDEPDQRPQIIPSQGIHIILDREFLPGQTAIMVPQTDDGRVLFAVPWHNKVVIGTTDTPVDSPTLEPRALDTEIEFVMKHAARYLTRDPLPEDVKSVFAGLRPLVKAPDKKNTSSLSRDHVITVSASGLISISGGKWTTYRKMAQDVIDQAAIIAGLMDSKCVTENMLIHGGSSDVAPDNTLFQYGSDASEIDKLIEQNPELGDKIHLKLPYIKAEVIWGVKKEMAQTVEDILARRTRSLLLDATASMESAPLIAQLMAAELKKDDVWQQEQVKQYIELAKGYLLG